MLKHLLLLSVFTGCAVDVQTSQSSDNLAAQNKLASNKLASNKLASNKLASNKLAAADLAADPTGLLSTADGRDVLSYIVSCALAGDQTLTATYDGTPYSFAGQIGLAPAWATRTPTASERRWVSACVLSRTNYFGIAVELSLRGTPDVLATSPEEEAAYPAAEATFFGDLFDPTAISEYACESSFKVANEGNSSFTLRQCATQDGSTGLTRCGFTYTGTCNGTTVFPEAISINLH